MDTLTLDDATEIYISPIEANAPERTSTRLRERATVNQMIERIFGQDARLTHDPHGAPLLEGHPHIALSISHCSDACVVAVRRDGVRIGIDIERWREQLARVARRFLTPDEYTRYGVTPDTLLRCWTAKEAVFKAAGLPDLTLSAIEVTLHPTDSPLHHSSATARLLNPPTTDLCSSFTVTYLTPFPRLLALARRDKQRT